MASGKALTGGTNDPPKLGVTTSLLSFRGSSTQQLLISNLGGGSLQVTAAKSGTQASAVTLPSATLTEMNAVRRLMLDPRGELWTRDVTLLRNYKRSR